MNDFYDLGQRIGAQISGLSNTDFDFLKQATLLDDPEHESPEARQLSADFWRSFCHARAEFEKMANGPTLDYFLLKNLSEQELWIEEFQKMAEEYAEDIVQGKELSEADNIEKSATVINSLIPGAASRAVNTAPTLLKGLMAAGIGTGVAGGGLYWALQRSATEDSDKKLEAMQAKIDEYNKLKTMLKTTGDDSFTEEEAEMQKKINKY